MLCPTLQVACWCSDCNGKVMSPSAFEAHCGAGTHKNWRLSLRHAQEGCNIGSWLAGLGIAPPSARPRANKGHSRVDAGDVEAAGEGDEDGAPAPTPRPKHKQAKHKARKAAAGGGDGPAGDGQQAGDDEAAEGRQGDASALPHDATEVDVACKGISGLLDLHTWRVGLREGLGYKECGCGPS